MLAQVSRPPEPTTRTVQTMPLIESLDLTIRFGGHAAVDRVTCAFHAGALTAIVGPNGAGKTTWFNLLSGQLRPTSGRVLLSGADITRLGVAARAQRGIGRAFQLTSLFLGLSVGENVRLAVQARSAGAGALFHHPQRAQLWLERSLHFLEAVALADKQGFLAAALSHGDQRKLEVALMLALEPCVLMFDEPTAGMSLDEAPVILDLIRQAKGAANSTILLVEHKMDVVLNLADRVVVLHDGQLLADGSPQAVMASSAVRDAYLGQAIVSAGAANG